jgi:hypothetical protein
MEIKYYYSTASLFRIRAVAYYFCPSSPKEDQEEFGKNLAKRHRYPVTCKEVRAYSLQWGSWYLFDHHLKRDTKITLFLFVAKNILP